MTYNFDPDRWYEDERRRINLRHQDGELDQAAYEAALEDLERRYEGLLVRLDGAFQLPRRGDAK